MIVHGIVRKGYGIASGSAAGSPYPDGSLLWQLPHFKNAGLDLTSFYRGTINVDISPKKWCPITVDFTFHDIAWIDIIPPETFSFIHCDISYRDKEYKGWIYYPHPETKPDHFQDPCIIEVITHFIDNLHYGDSLSLSVDRNKIRLF